MSPAADGVIDSDRPMVSGITAEATDLIAQVCSGTSVVWVRPLDDTRHHLAWHVWHDNAVHILAGVGEQRVPLMIGTVEVAVTGKGSTARAVTFLARAESLTPGTESWNAAADVLAGKRLNAVETHAEIGEQRSRWASGGVITRLTPVRLIARGPAEPGSSETPPLGDTVPRATPATTLTRRPWHLGGRPERRRRG